ncbi:MAG: hypothetical protein V3V08_22625 [Nannocystaceae bacterium]
MRQVAHRGFVFDPLGMSLPPFGGHRTARYPSAGAGAENNNERKEAAHARKYVDHARLCWGGSEPVNFVFGDCVMTTPSRQERADEPIVVPRAEVSTAESR